jgi:hypothetical protein
MNSPSTFNGTLSQTTIQLLMIELLNLSIIPIDMSKTQQLTNIKVHFSTSNRGNRVVDMIQCDYIKGIEK